MYTVKHYYNGHWHIPKEPFCTIVDPYHQTTVGQYSTATLDYDSIVSYARDVGIKEVQNYTIYERALHIRKLASYLTNQKQSLKELSVKTGATKKDTWLDIDGGIATLFIISSKARRELSDHFCYVEGDNETLSAKGSFVGQHIYVPKNGITIHINAFNFPCWGLLEKLASAYIAGMPMIIKPSPIGSFLAEKLIENIIESNLLPKGAIQFIATDIPGNLLSKLNSQDIVAFTGSSETGKKLRMNPIIQQNNVRFFMETDSINASILGMKADHQSEEFDLFTDEIVREITSKAGQKCTAIRRALVPSSMVKHIIESLKNKLNNIKTGDPANKETAMGPLANKEQLKRFTDQLNQLKKEALIVIGNESTTTLQQLTPFILLKQEEGICVHHTEAFGPACTIIPYNSKDEAITLANAAQGSLVASIFTPDDKESAFLVKGIAPYHGRIVLINKHCSAESTGHGSPLPHLTHGGPGRAGNSEELGGIRGILNYMQRIALQGHPTTIQAITNQYIIGAKTTTTAIHPFRFSFEDLKIGQNIETHKRTVTETDIVNFGCISGDHFYAHFDEIAAKNSLFKCRVAHGYFILSASAGLFVDPNPGPVLANYGLENLRFIHPVKIGDTIKASLTVKTKTKKNA